MENIYYINLDSRTDRRSSIEKQLSKYNISYNRFEAIQHVNGLMGCAMSHIEALRKCNSELEYNIILEDDFLILDDGNFKSFLQDFDSIKNNPDWDIIVLTPSGKTISGNETLEKSGFKRIINNQTATGYIIKKHMIPLIIDCFRESLEGFFKYPNDPNKYALDQYWKIIQPKYNFYYYSKIFAGQLVGYSDIENRHINYNKRFLDQIHF
jgi:GR25 family glycosyltransferase involved in LPS biosynthesis